MENVPVFAAIVVALYVSGVDGPVDNYLSMAILAARVAQSLTHVAFVQTNTVVMVRFVFFFVQVISFLWLAALVFGRAGLA